MSNVLQFPAKQDPVEKAEISSHGYSRPEELIYAFGNIPKPNYYILRGKDTVKVDTALEWSLWFSEASNKTVGRSRVGWLTVSTVFLGLDHNIFGDKPHLFETMIFSNCQTESLANGCGDLAYFLRLQKRYPTWEEAFRGHQMAIDYISSRLTLVNCMQRILESVRRKEADTNEQQSD